MVPPRGFYWDTNIFIILREQTGSAHDLLWQLLEVARARTLPISTSALTFSELMVKPLQQGNGDLLKTYEDWSSSAQWMDIWPINRPILERAALLRASRTGLKLPDAIHVATALHIGCDCMMTADMGVKDVSELIHPLRGPLSIAPLTVIRPDEPTLTSLLQSLAA